MESHPGKSKFVGGFDSDDAMSQGGKYRRVRSGSRADIQQAARGAGDQMEDMPVFLRERDALGSFGDGSPA